jgi:hypothetical protein
MHTRLKSTNGQTQTQNMHPSTTTAHMAHATATKHNANAKPHKKTTLCRHTWPACSGYTLIKTPNHQHMAYQSGPLSKLVHFLVSSGLSPVAATVLPSSLPLLLASCCCLSVPSSTACWGCSASTCCHYQLLLLLLLLLFAGTCQYCKLLMLLFAIIAGHLLLLPGAGDALPPCAVADSCRCCC